MEFDFYSCCDRKGKVTICADRATHRAENAKRRKQPRRRIDKEKVGMNTVEEIRRDRQVKDQ